MTAVELAAMLNGRKYSEEITKQEESQAKQDGLVVIFGYSDDNAEICGAIDDEVGCYDGGTICLTKSGVLQEPDCLSGIGYCRYYEQAKRAAKTIEAKWNDAGGPCWSYETDIPHETFEIFDGDELFCVGIVFSVEDLA